MRSPWDGYQTYSIRHLRVDLLGRARARALLRHTTIEGVLNEALGAGLAALEAGNGGAA